MHLARTLFTLVSCVVATASASSVRALRQHVAPRAQTDTCVYTYIPTVESDGTLGPNAPVCYCLSGIPDVISSSVELVAAVGIPYLLDLLTELVHDFGEACTYPPGVTPVCSETDPCGFQQCSAPYVEQDSQCVCAAPYTSCNGVCDVFPNGCGSAVPQNPGKRNVLAGRSLGITTQAEAQTTCQIGETVCGVPRGSVGFECLDLARTLDSCGGCMYPSPFLLPSEQEPQGKDCSVLPNALDVGCVAGGCVVRRCKTGFSVSAAGDACQADSMAPLFVQPR
ncbi:hypothetical protein FA95DRAFT_297109 [Auriscalpium vulgare]|uniref:Uncharacterized protein n=1 Tax=Auriscalpium vulgare TaxID=40419 RepID=A0ACB8RJV8_9AGAM|nr:hypothetical protein FA95DRAFT_297109 [Auriscalpium vulgare]